MQFLDVDDDERCAVILFPFAVDVIVVVVVVVHENSLLLSSSHKHSEILMMVVPSFSPFASTLH